MTFPSPVCVLLKGTASACHNSRVADAFRSALSAVEGQGVKAQPQRLNCLPQPATNHPRTKWKNKVAKIVYFLLPEKCAPVNHICRTFYRELTTKTPQLRHTFSKPQQKHAAPHQKKSFNHTIKSPYLISGSYACRQASSPTPVPTPSLKPWTASSPSSAPKT